MNRTKMDTLFRITNVYDFIFIKKIGNGSSDNGIKSEDHALRYCPKPFQKGEKVSSVGEFPLRSRA